MSEVPHAGENHRDDFVVHNSYTLTSIPLYLFQVLSEPDEGLANSYDGTIWHTGGEIKMVGIAFLGISRRELKIFPTTKCLAQAWCTLITVRVGVRAR